MQFHAAVLLLFTPSNCGKDLHFHMQVALCLAVFLTHFVAVYGPRTVQHLKCCSSMSLHEARLEENLTAGTQCGSSLTVAL